MAPWNRSASETEIVSAFVLSTLLISALPAGAEFELAAESNAEIVASISGQRMLETVNALAGYGTRVFYTNSSFNSSVYIHDRFESLGLWVYYQELEVSGSIVRNVVAVMNGTDTAAPQYLFGAHYDSAVANFTNHSVGETVPAPGADDDASGVAAVIELATVLTKERFTRTVKFVAFTAEESGLNGSWYFAQRERADGVRYAGTAILDMIGYRTYTANEAMVFQDTSSNRLASAIFSAVSVYVLDLDMASVIGYEMVYSDHASFWANQYPSLLMIEVLNGGVPSNPFYHTSEDTPGHVSSQQMAEITKAVLGGFIDLETPLAPRSSSTGMIIIGIAVIAIAAALTAYFVRQRRWRE